MAITRKKQIECGFTLLHMKFLSDPPGFVINMTQMRDWTRWANSEFKTMRHKKFWKNINDRMDHLDTLWAGTWWRNMGELQNGFNAIGREILVELGEDPYA